MNDPKENKERAVQICRSIDIEVPLEMIDKAPTLLNDAVLEYSKLFCTTLDAKENPLDLNTKRCFGRPRMWAQYGDNHRGVCLAFDCEGLTAEIRSLLESDAALSDVALWPGDVSYSDHLKKTDPHVSVIDYDLVGGRGIGIALKDHVAKFSKVLFFRKDSDWSGESERRWVIYCREYGYKYLPFGNSLKAIVMGVDSSPVYVPSLRSLAGDVPLFRLRWDHSKEDFLYEEI